MAAVIGLMAGEVRGQVSITNPTATYTQNFDTLITSGTNQTWTNNTTLLGWHLFVQPAPGTAVTQYSAGAGSSGTGSFYSFGTGTDSDRALGGLASGSAYFGSPAPSSGTVAGWLAVSFTNNTGAPITNPEIRYDGEQWRNGGNSSLASQTMVMEYGVGSSFTAVGTWTAAGTVFNFTSVVNSPSSAAAVDGNTAGRVANIGGTLDLVTSVQDGDTLWIRWIELNDTGNDHGLAIDNFRFTPVPEPGTVFGLGAAVLAAGTLIRRKKSTRRRRAGV
jgi:hypothetical protein